MGRRHGHSSKQIRNLRRKVRRRDGNLCARCGLVGNKPGMLTLDHIKPLSKGGGWEMDNLQVLCAPCNIEKGTRTVRYTKYQREKPIW